MSAPGFSETLRGLPLLTALDEAPDLICICDEEDAVVFASDASTALLGCSPSDLVGSDVSLLDHIDDQPAMAFARAEAWRLREPVRRLHRVRQTAGGYRWLDTTVRVIDTEQGCFSMLISRDASGVQELARTGRLSRERLSTLVGAMPDAVVLTDPAGEIEAASEAWVELLGQVGDPVGLSVVTICRWQLGRDAGVRVEQLLRRASARQVPQRTLVAAVPMHGQIAVTATPLVTPVVGGIEHAVLVFGREQEPHETDEDAVELAHELTGRELEVLRGLAEGCSPREVAQQLSLCDSTVRGYVKSLLQKLRVHSQLQPVLVGMQAGVVPVPGGAGRPVGKGGR